MMTPPSNYRVQSVDFLKGLVMVIMALDHTRDYFHAAAYAFDPADPTQTTLPIFFTRWITHFCAPSFSFLAGISAFMASQRRTRGQLSVFLVKRGLWLVFIELTVVAFAWFFDVQFRTFGLLVIWALGISMIVLSVLVHLPRNLILAFSLLLICCHHVLDNVHYPGSPWWSILHELSFYRLTEHTQLLIGYPLIPWIAVMALGYYFGAFYQKSFNAGKRKTMFNIIGLSAIALFILLRWANLYGDPNPFKRFDTVAQSLVSFLNPSKYPPSLLYLLMTLGGAFLFLANTENARGRIVNFFCTFGRVPFFYYILHLYFIHGAAMILALLSGFTWDKLVFSTWISFDPDIKGWGFGLWVVYLVWVTIILLLYPLCKKFDRYKQSHKQYAWLSYF